ncbi:TolC family protein [Pseudocnuella soli]|uniref:TolC family protein n=1 Tax=Pseudocnuella soli TaxID=2502779 RepID=UPI001404A8C6|nr:TolC family protein [Pseudocnuella soli]
MSNKEGSKQRKWGKRWGLLTALVLMLGAAQAQEPVQLTLKDALKYALEANQDARKANLDVENAQYQIDEVRSRALPQINGSAAMTYNALLQQSALPNIFGPNPNPNETILIAFGQKWNANAGVALSQALFDKSVLTGLKAARTTQEFYRVNAQLTEEQIIEQVATNYYQLLVQRQQVGVLDTTIRNTRRVQDVLQGLLENGLAKKIDVDRVRVNLSNLTSQRQQLLNGVTLLENQLKFLIGMPIQTQIVVPDVARGDIQPRAVPSNEPANIDNRLELQILKRQEELLTYQKEAYKSEYYPSLSLSGNYSYQGIGNKVPVFKGPSKGVNWFDVAAVSLNLRIPIFNGFATKARVKQADVSIRKVAEDISKTSLALNLAFENAKTQINNSIITLNTQKENVELAEEVYFNTQNNYNNGLASLTDLLNAETSLTEANNNYSAALLNYRVAEIQLIKSQGGLKSLLN